MRIADPVRVQVVSFDLQRRLGLVTFSEHARIRVGAVALTHPVGQPDVLIPVLFSSGGRVYRADDSPLRADEDERHGMYFIRQQVCSWFSSGEDARSTQGAVA